MENVRRCWRLRITVLRLKSKVANQLTYEANTTTNSERALARKYVNVSAVALLGRSAIQSNSTSRWLGSVTSGDDNWKGIYDFDELFRIGNSSDRKQRGKIYIPDPEYSVPLDDPELIMTFAAAEPITTLPLVSSPVPDWIFTYMVQVKIDVYDDINRLGKRGGGVLMRFKFEQR